MTSPKSSTPPARRSIGGTFKGAIDDQKAIGEVLDSAKPVAVYRHLDAALFGGYLPFLEDCGARGIVDASKMNFDSIAVSGHKFFSLNEPAGVFICRKRVLDCVHGNPVPYLKGVIPTLSCSRSGLDALKLFWRIKSLGSAGLGEQAKHCLKMADLLLEGLRDKGVKAYKNPYSNTVFFDRPPEWVVKKYALACSEYEDFGKLSHIVTMQYFTPELINSVILDIVK